MTGVGRGVPARKRPGVDPVPVAAAADPGDDFERAAVDNLYDGVYYVDRARRIRYWNHGAERLSGFPAAEVVGHFCYDNLLNHVDSAGRHLCRGRCPLAATIADGEPREAEVFLRHRQGHRVPVRVRTAPVHDREGRVIGAVEVFDDSTALSTARQEASELRDLAMRDALTGIPNRRHFEMSIASRVAELAGYGRRFGFLIADIDHFKLVNDRHGHATGDVALTTVARTLLGASRAGDDLARFGGEEFALTITDVDGPALRKVAERFRVLVQQTRVRDATADVELGVTISIGGTVAVPGDTAEAIFGRADAALYTAKASGRNVVRLAEDAEVGADEEP